jgi:prepilin-type N-terminal cleavage/methylation domain-containing protein
MRIEKKAYILSKNKMGFTLIELLMALAIMSIVFGAIYAAFSFSSQSYTTQGVTADVQQSVRAAMEIMVQDIRAAGLDPTASDNFGVELATATKFRITSDSIDAGIGDFNGVLDDTNSERITYELQGNQLNQILYETTVNENSQPLISDVQNLTFTYFDTDGNDLGSPVPVANLENICTVEITMTVEEPAGLDEPVSRTLTKRVKCRNLAFN